MITFKGYTVDLTLPNPELEDTLGLNGHVELKRDYAGAIHTTRQTPITKSLVLDFIRLTRYKFYEVRAFIKDNVGREFTYIDINEDEHQVKFTDETITLTTVQGGPMVTGTDEKEEYMDFQINLEIV